MDALHRELGQTARAWNGRSQLPQPHELSPPRSSPLSEMPQTQTARDFHEVDLADKHNQPHPDTPRSPRSEKTGVTGGERTERWSMSTMGTAFAQVQTLLLGRKAHPRGEAMAAASSAVDSRTDAGGPGESPACAEYTDASGEHVALATLYFNSDEFGPGSPPANALVKERKMEIERLWKTQRKASQAHDDRKRPAPLSSTKATGSASRSRQLAVGSSPAPPVAFKGISKAPHSGRERSTPTRTERSKAPPTRSTRAPTETSVSMYSVNTQSDASNSTIRPGDPSVQLSRSGPSEAGSDLLNRFTFQLP